MKLLVRRPPASASAQIAAWSAAGLDVALEGAAELWVTLFADRAALLGAFQRNLAPEAAEPSFKRGSGGASVPVGPDTLHVAVVLSRASALTPCPPSRLVNRYVRPLLKALSRLGAPAHYFGRDTVNVHHRPVGWIGFAHDAGSGRAVVEALVQAATLREVLGRAVDLGALADGVVRSYLDAYAGSEPSRVTAGGPPVAAIGLAARVDPPWSATVAEAIGPLGAGPDADGRFRVGGDWLVSRDAVAALEAGAADLPGGDRAAVVELVEGAFGRPGVLLEGVRSLESVVDLIARARGCA